MQKSNQKGITLIALIITIIVMLILVGVTVDVALNGGLFDKAKKAAYLTNVSTIKEQIEIEKAIQISNNDGKNFDSFNIEISDLAISDALKTEFGTKLVVSTDGKLYYNVDAVTNIQEQNWLKEIGINEYNGIPNEDTVIGFYGNSEDIGIEFKENGTAIFYMDGGTINGTYNVAAQTAEFSYYDSEYEEDVTQVINYEFTVIKENGKIKNKILFIEEMPETIFTTNGLVGVGSNYLDGKRFEQETSPDTYPIDFENGICSSNVTSGWSEKYTVFNNGIYMGDNNIYELSYTMESEDRFYRQTSTNELIYYSEVK